MAAPLANLGIFELFCVIAVEDRFDQNIKIRKCSLGENFMNVRLVEKIFDISHSRCRQGPKWAKKNFLVKTKDCPKLILNFLAPIMYLDLFSITSKI